MPERLPCPRLPIGCIRGLLPVAKVVEVMLAPLETFSFYFTLFLIFFPPQPRGRTRTVAGTA